MQVFYLDLATFLVMGQPPSSQGAQEAHHSSQNGGIAKFLGKNLDRVEGIQKNAASAPFPSDSKTDEGRREGNAVLLESVALACLLSMTRLVLLVLLGQPQTKIILKCFFCMSPSRILSLPISNKHHSHHHLIIFLIGKQQRE
jgi:hypothetical protein